MNESKRMSGPYCRQCKYFNVNFRTDTKGVCTDPTKEIIFSKTHGVYHGGEIGIKYPDSLECPNWTGSNEEDKYL